MVKRRIIYGWLFLLAGCASHGPMGEILNMGSHFRITRAVCANTIDYEVDFKNGALKGRETMGIYPQKTKSLSCANATSYHIRSLVEPTGLNDDQISRLNSLLSSMSFQEYGNGGDHCGDNPARFTWFPISIYIDGRTQPYSTLQYSCLSVTIPDEAEFLKTLAEIFAQLNPVVETSDVVDAQ